METKIHASTRVQMKSNVAAIHFPVCKRRVLIHSAADASRDSGTMLLQYKNRRVMARLPVRSLENNIAEPRAS